MEVKIYKPAKSAMQSGKAKSKWLVAPMEKENIRHLNKLMGWVSVDNTISQLDFAFNSKDEAIEFAKKNNLKYVVEEPNLGSLKKKSYAANFTG
jgi:hypothetical protein